jgi:hypothetical protein
MSDCALALTAKGALEAPIQNIFAVLLNPPRKTLKAASEYTTNSTEHESKTQQTSGVDAK